MSTFDKTAPSQTESISFEFDLPHAPEKVWRALTEPELLAEWLLPVIRSSGQNPSSLIADGPLQGRVAELKLEPGAAFAFLRATRSWWSRAPAT